MRQPVCVSITQRDIIQYLLYASHTIICLTLFFFPLLPSNKGYPPPLSLAYPRDVQRKVAR